MINPCQQENLPSKPEEDRCDNDCTHFVKDVKGREILQEFCGNAKKFGYSKQGILEFKRQVYDYCECNNQGMAENEEEEQMHML